MIVLSFLMQGEFTCKTSPDDFREPTAGIGLLALGYRFLSADAPRPLEPIFHIEVIMDPDCTRWVPKGFVVQNTRFLDFQKETTEQKEMFQSKTTHEWHASAKLGLTVGSFGASVESKYRKSSSSDKFNQSTSTRFVTTIQSAQNTFRIQKLDTPKLSKKIREAVDDFVRNVRPTGTWNHNQTGELITMAARFGSFIKYAETGSLMTECRVINTQDLRSIESQSSSFDVKASAHYAAFSANANYGQSDDETNAHKQFVSKSKSFRFEIGDHLTEDSGTIVSRVPGLIAIEHAPICELMQPPYFEESDALKLTQEQCWNAVTSQEFCVAALQDDEDEDMLKKTFAEIRSFGQCFKISPPFFGFKFASDAKDAAARYKEGGHSLAECARLCQREGCSSWVHCDGECFLRRHSHHYYGSYITRCSESENCVGGMLERWHDALPVDVGIVDWDHGLFLPKSSLVVAELLEEVRFVDYIPNLEEAESIFETYAKATGSEPVFDGPERDRRKKRMRFNENSVRALSKDVLKIIAYKVHRKCLAVCREHDSCDAYEIATWPVYLDFANINNGTTESLFLLWKSSVENVKPRLQALGIGYRLLLSGKMIHMKSAVVCRVFRKESLFYVKAMPDKLCEDENTKPLCDISVSVVFPYQR